MVKGRSYPIVSLEEKQIITWNSYIKDCPLERFGFDDFCEHILLKYKFGCTNIMTVYKRNTLRIQITTKLRVKKENSIKVGLANGSAL